MKQETTQKKVSPSNQYFLELDCVAYKNCINCGQNLYPFKHGICRVCGENNFIVDYDVGKVEKLGIKELLDN